MRSTRLLAVAVLAAMATACSDQGSPVQTAPRAAPVLSARKDPIPGSYIVVLKEGANPRSVAAVAGVDPRHVYTAALNGFAVTLNSGQLNALSHNPNVAYIEQDARITVATTQTGATWGLDRIDQRNRPLNGTYTYTPTGAGVNAYILDTGILTSHEEFGGRASVGYDVYAGTGQDCNGHGTHVAGTVGGTTYGVAKNVSLIAVRVLNCAGSGSVSDIIAGMDWVTSHHVKPAVANMSLGGGFTPSVNEAAQHMIDAGVTLVVAAGNSNENACNVSPASTPSAITVGATTSADARASFSNFGSCVDLFAPGENITSAWVEGLGGGGGGGGEISPDEPEYPEQPQLPGQSFGAANIRTESGTSMAAPHVAGVAALYLQGNPTATPATVAAAILNNATVNVVTGAGSGSPNRLLYSLLPQPYASTIITGTSRISEAGYYTWQANAAGGDGTYTYLWEYRVQNGTWSVVGTGSSFTGKYIISSPSFELRVTVTSAGTTASDTHLVTVAIPIPAAPAAAITGPSSISAAGNYTWQANASGGDGTYSYAWEYRVQNGTWSAAGTGSSYTRSVAAGDPSFELRVTVTSAGASASATQLVDVAASQAPQANITGPANVYVPGSRTWQANASGGNGVYTYQWQYRVQGATTWTNVGTGSSYTRTVGSTSPSFELKVTVTSAGLSGSDTHLVNVEMQPMCGGVPC